MPLEYSQEFSEYERAAERKASALAALHEVKRLIDNGVPEKVALGIVIDQIRKNEVSY